MNSLPGMGQTVVIQPPSERSGPPDTGHGRPAFGVQNQLGGAEILIDVERF
jgi:hypothetical protein